MAQIGKHIRTVHEEPMLPAPLFAPPVRVPEQVPVTVAPQRESAS